MSATLDLDIYPLDHLPPRGEDLPWDDGEPMETWRHKCQMDLLIGSLELAWENRDDFFVSGNMFFYFSEIQAKRNDFRGPDLFVVLNTEHKERKSWVVWEEDGKVPDVVIEFLSPKTEKIDRGRKKEIYAGLRVSRYYLFDPFSKVLEGYRFVAETRQYEPLEPLPNGDLSCTVLGLDLGIRFGHFRSIDTEWLRWIDPKGMVLPTGDEAARAASERVKTESARAEQERFRAQAERDRADEAAQRAAELAARLAEYEKRFGVLGP